MTHSLKDKRVVVTREESVETGGESYDKTEWYWFKYNLKVDDDGFIVYVPKEEDED